MGLLDEILAAAAEKVLVREFVEPWRAEWRATECLLCPRRDPEANQCRVCGCYLAPKTKAKKNWNPVRGRVEITHCPEGRWDDRETANEYRKMDGQPPLPEPHT